MDTHNKAGLTDVPVSLWIASTQDTDYPKVEDDLDVDVAIIGGGITGITTAYLLKKAGVRVAVIDSNKIVKGGSGHTTAKITSQHSLKYYKMVNAVGEEKARQYADANQEAISLVEKIISENNIECDFRRAPAYVFTEDEKYVQKIEDEVKTASKLGLPAEFTEEHELPFKVKCLEKFSDQACFHPRKYLLALASIIEGEDCRIYENTRVVSIEEGKDVHTAITDSGKKIRAKSIVQATRYPIYDKPDRKSVV
jgi:glycine/D-amino acid oxidase-like deaminating enzyme